MKIFSVCFISNNMKKLYQIVQISNQKTFFQISNKITETLLPLGKLICFVAAYSQYMNTASYAAPNISTRESSRFWIIHKNCRYDNTAKQYSMIYLMYRHFLPSGQADLLCYSAFAVYEYGFIRCASHINL